MCPHPRQNTSGGHFRAARRHRDLDLCRYRTLDIAVWGTVTRWEPGAAVAFTWHPGRSPEQSSHVEVSFTAVGSQTRVTLEHSGWQAFDDPAAARTEYEHGWPVVLARYRDQAGRSRGQDQAHTWVALLHRPGPGAPADGNVFDDPRFADHIAFLGRMREAGHLVAAGPSPTCLATA